MKNHAADGLTTADLLESAGNRSPEPAVLFYVTDDDRAGEGVERLIRTAGFEPVKAGARAWKPVMDSYPQGHRHEQPLVLPQGSTAGKSSVKVSPSADRRRR